MEEKENINKLSIKEKLAFGLGDGATNILFAAVSFYLLYFFINVGGLKPALASAVFLVAKAWDAITDYAMGRIVDKTHSRFGKRKVYMIFGAIPYVISFVLLWLAPNDMNDVTKFIFYTAMYMLYCTTWTIVYIPYNTLAPNMTKDYDERTSLNSLRIICANIGLILGAAVFALLADGKESIFYGLFNSEKYAYLAAAGVFGLLGLIVWFICTFNVQERFEDVEENNKGFIQTLKEFFKLKEFRTIMLTFLLSMMGFDIIMTVFVFYINDSLGFGSDATMSMVFIAIPLICAILSAPLWDLLCKKWQKHIVYIIACVYMSLVLLLALIVPANNVLITILHVVLCGIGMSAIQIIPYASLPDVVDVDEYVNGQRREGAFYGVSQFCYKLASGVGCAMVSLVLGLAGYIEANSEKYYEYINNGLEVVQPKGALMAIRIILAIIPGVIFLLSAIAAYRANLGRDRFNKIIKELEEKHNAQKGLKEDS